MAISYVGSGSGIASISLAAGQAVGDLIIIVAQGNGVLPGTPSGFTSLSTADDGTYIRSRVSYKIAVSGDVPTCSISSSSTSDILAVVYRGTATSPFGSTASQVNSSPTSIVYPALTLSVTDGSSWVVGFAMSWKSTASPVISVETPPTGMTNRLYRAWDNGSSSYLRLAGHDTAGGVSSWSQQSVSISSAKNGAYVLELKDMPSSSFSSSGAGALSISSSSLITSQLASSAAGSVGVTATRVVPAEAATSGNASAALDGVPLLASDLSSSGVGAVGWDGNAVTRLTADLSSIGQAGTSLETTTLSTVIAQIVAVGGCGWDSLRIRTTQSNSAASGLLSADSQVLSQSEWSAVGTSSTDFIGVGDSYFAINAQGSVSVAGSVTVQSEWAASAAGGMGFAGVGVYESPISITGAANTSWGAQAINTTRGQITASAGVGGIPAQVLPSLMTTTTPTLSRFESVQVRPGDIALVGYADTNLLGAGIHSAESSIQGSSECSVSGYGAVSSEWTVQGSSACVGYTGVWMRAPEVAARPVETHRILRSAEPHLTQDDAPAPNAQHKPETRTAMRP